MQARCLTGAIAFPALDLELLYNRRPQDRDDDRLLNQIQQTTFPNCAFAFCDYSLSSYDFNDHYLNQSSSQSKHSPMAAPPPPPRGLSLYENLLDPNDPSSATISSAPVLYNQTDDANSESVKKTVDPAFRFQPIRRPQVKQTKPKPTFPKTIPNPPTATASTASAPTTAPAPPKSTLADWAATEEDEWRYGLGDKRQRGGRKKKKKQQQTQVETDWDDLYDPSRPTNVEEYLRSDEKIDEVREWKALLYRHRRKRDESDLSDDEEDYKPSMPSKSSEEKRLMKYLSFLPQINLPLHQLTLLCLHRPNRLQHNLQHHLQTTLPAMRPSRVAWPWDKAKTFSVSRQSLHLQLRTRLSLIRRQYRGHRSDTTSLRSPRMMTRTTGTHHRHQSVNPRTSLSLSPSNALHAPAKQGSHTV